jgi:hypothetical protein
MPNPSVRMIAPQTSTRTGVRQLGWDVIESSLSLAFDFVCVSKDGGKAGRNRSEDWCFVFSPLASCRLPLAWKL